MSKPRETMPPSRLSKPTHRERPEKSPPRLRRADSFFGLHFDFHAGEDCKTVGETVTPEMVEAIIAAAQPDFIQCDCKGHPGISSYPTKVGHPAPGFVRDPLRIFRDVTAAHGVALYLHYSGVWDHAAIKSHPRWARIDEKGKRDPNNTSVFGPYVDELLIPQLKELRTEYGVDGVWLDGECWATCQDYGKAVMEKFKAQTGIETVPRAAGEPHFFEWTEFNREAFRRYLRYYVDALHAWDPDFQIASNWAFSSFMPEPVSAKVDFLSGDYPLSNSVNAARLEARCLAPQGVPWDLMAWGFAGRFGQGCYSIKTAVQLQQEAAVVLATGGGFQMYFQQKRDASVPLWPLPIMREVAEFCRARQEFCHRTEAVPQIALVNSSADYYHKSPRVFSPWHGELAPLNGVLCALLEKQHAVEIQSEHHLRGRMAEYPLIIVPEAEQLDPKFRRELVRYVRAGGKLLLIGPRTAALFEKELGVRLEGEAAEGCRWLEHEGKLGGVSAVFQAARCGKNAVPLGALHAKADTGGEGTPAASVAALGAGTIAATYVNLGNDFAKASNTVARDFLESLVRTLFPRPMVEVNGSRYVDVNLQQREGKLSLHLINTAGPHADENVFVFNEVPPLGPLEVTLRLGKKPRKLVRQPGGTEIPFTWSKGEARFTIPRLEIYEIVTVG